MLLSNKDFVIFKVIFVIFLTDWLKKITFNFRNINREGVIIEMNNFVYENPTKIIFGRNTECEIGTETVKYSKNILLHYGGGSIKKSGLYDIITNSLSSSGISFTELPGVRSNPRLSLVNEGIKVCREKSIDFILAVGGGSVIDSAKAIAIGVLYDGDVWDFYDGKTRPTKALPLATILTIPAAGSESSPNSVITNEDGLLKRGTGALCMRPKFSILNPALAATLPQNQIANGISDMCAHIFERYFTHTKNTDITDGLCESVLNTIIKNAPTVYSNPDNYDAWCQVMWAGNLAHNGLLGVGREEDWASHGIEHEISAIYDIAHGAGLSIVFPAWMKYVKEEDPDMFMRFSKNVMKESSVDMAIEKLENFYRSINLPTRLSHIGIGDENISVMAHKATCFRQLGKLKYLTEKDVENILHLAV